MFSRNYNTINPDAGKSFRKAQLQTAPAKQGKTTEKGIACGNI